MTDRRNTPASRASLLVVALVTGRCSNGGPVAPRPDVVDVAVDRGPLCGDAVAQRAGLQLRARFTAPNGGTSQNAGHLNEILPLGDVLYAANAEDMVATFGLDANGAVRSIAALPAGVDVRAPRVCTTVALHAPSRTLFCGFTEDASRGLMSFRLDERAVPALRDPRPAESLVLNVRHLHVAGDTLYLALFRNGLWAATIDAEGRLSNLRDTGLAGDVRFVEGDASRLVVLDRDRGVIVARAEGERVVEVSRVGFDGPKLGLSLRGDHALVALGSVGAYVVNVASTPPRIETIVRPPCVVTSVDRDGDALAVACTSGVFLYDLSAPTPRVAGYGNARAIMLHARFHGAELLVADWLDVVRYRVNVRGQARALDVSWGSYDREDATARLVVRNVTDEPLAFRVRNLFPRRTVAPGANASVDLPANLFRAEGDDQWFLAMEVLTEDDAGCETARFESRALRRRGALGPRSRPAVGDRLPSLTLASPEGGSFTVPRAGEPVRLVFYEADCAAMWPEMQDLDHLAARRMAPDGALPVLISGENPARLHVPERWNLRAVRFGYTGTEFDAVPADVEATNARYGGDVYLHGFIHNDMLSGARHPTDYTVDGDGVVRAVERLYRGAWPLR